MKAVAAGIVTAALVAAGIFGTAPETGRGFTDADRDGVCDYYDGRGTGAGVCYTDEDGDGVCDYYNGRGTGAGAGYVDEDGDRVCDNFTSGACGYGGQRGRGGRRCGRR